MCVFPRAHTHTHTHTHSISVYMSVVPPTSLLVLISLILALTRESNKNHDTTPLHAQGYLATSFSRTTTSVHVCVHELIPPYEDHTPPLNAYHNVEPQYFPHVYAHAVSLTTANTCNVMTIMSLPFVTNQLYDLILTKTNSILQSIRGRDFFLHRVSGSRVLWTVKGADTPPTCIINLI